MGGSLPRAILESELRPYVTETSRVPLDGPEIRLPAGPAVVLGMAFHELATNAVKYGSLSVAAGRVEVEWHLGVSGDETLLAVEWCELDGPEVEAQPSPGFGSRLLRQTIVGELAGQLEVRFAPEGLCCTIAVPIRLSERKTA